MSIDRVSAAGGDDRSEGTPEVETFEPPETAPGWEEHAAVSSSSAPGGDVEIDVKAAVTSSSSATGSAVKAKAATGSILATLRDGGVSILKGAGKALGALLVVVGGVGAFFTHLVGKVPVALISKGRVESEFQKKDVAAHAAFTALEAARLNKTTAMSKLKKAISDDIKDLTELKSKVEAATKGLNAAEAKYKKANKEFREVGVSALKVGIALSGFGILPAVDWIVSGIGKLGLALMKASGVDPRSRAMRGATHYFDTAIDHLVKTSKPAKIANEE